MKKTMARLSPFCQRGGFTLTEILVVTAIVSALISLLLPTLQEVKEDGRRVVCMSNMRQIGIAFRLFQDDNNGMYPKGWDDNSNNWEAYLAYQKRPNGATPNHYLPTTYVTPVDPTTFARRFVERFWCPTEKIILSKGHPNDQLWFYAPRLDNNWGYALNLFRTNVSYVNDPIMPAFWAHQKCDGMSLDILYPAPETRAVLTDGNGTSWNSDGDYDAFTAAWWNNEAQITGIHHGGVNVLFMDGHVVYTKVQTAPEKAAFNKTWYSGVPVLPSGYPANPWPD